MDKIELSKEIKELDSYLKKSQSDLSKLPEGLLKVIKKKKRTEYWVKQKSDSSYLYCRNNIDFPQKLAMHNYLQEVVPIMQERVKVLKKLERLINEDKITQAYSKLSDARKELITPYRLDDQTYVDKWLSISYLSKDFNSDDIYYLTNRKEKVRSKSEKIIADELFRRGIPYRYEYPYHLTNGVTLYPDFTVLNVRTRKEFIFEHFGMMDDLNYVQNFILKIETYIKIGFFPGEKLIYTMETKESPLNISVLDKLIKHFLI